MSAAPLRQSAAIAGTGTAVPPYTLTREDVKTYMRKVFDVGERRLDAMMTIIDHAQVRKRQSIFPVEYIVEARALDPLAQEYQTHSFGLGGQAGEQCLAAPSIAPPDTARIIPGPCTGSMIPSLDAH